MDLNRHPGTVQRLFAGYLLLVSVVCLAAAAGRPLPAGLLAVAHAVAAVLLFRTGRSPLPSRGRAHVWPYALWAACWLELGWIIHWTGQPWRDGGIAAADLAVFGGHGHLVLPALLPGAAPLMHAAYLSYYALILGPPLILALRGRHAQCERYTFELMATYLTCFAAYLVYPVLGPRAAAASGGAAELQAGFVGAEEVLRRLGDSLGTAFPSSHCAGAWSAALAAGAIVRTAARWGLATWAALITLATVMTGNHYGIDAAAGVLTAGVVRFVLSSVRMRRVASRPKEVLT